MFWEGGDGDAGGAGGINGDGVWVGRERVSWARGAAGSFWGRAAWGGLE